MCCEQIEDLGFTFSKPTSFVKSNLLIVANFTPYSNVIRATDILVFYPKKNLTVILFVTKSK